MAAGFQLFRNTGGTLLSINSERSAARIVASGTLTLNQNVPVEVPYPGAIGYSAPMVLLRPASSAFVGAFLSFENKFWIQGTNGVSCEWAIASNFGAPLVHANGSGMELFNSNGELTFSSNHRHPRILQIAETLIASKEGSTISVGAFPSAPWLVANELVYSYESPQGLGSDLSYPSFVYVAQFLASNSQIRLYIRDSATMQDGVNVTFNSAYNVYQTRPLRVPLCYIPGY